MANPFGTPASSPFGTSGTANPFATPAATGTGFGAPATPGSAFGAAASPFGQTSTPLFGSGTFGASQPAFGAGSSPSVFGSSSAPAFGASASPFGGSLFGQQQKSFGGFGASQPGASPFGAQSAFGQPSQQSQPAFGAGTSTFGSSAPAFGSSAPAFGATSAFGASSTPAFGAASAPAFGASPAAPFGSGATGLFGATGAGFGLGSTGTFGASTGPAFGATTFGVAGSFAQGGGSRSPPYAQTPDTETSAGATQGSFTTITAMPAFRNKSVDELRWEDYQKGDKGGPASGSSSPFGQPQAAAPTASPFGSTFGTAPSNPFGASATTPSLFGSTSAFGASSAPAFGASPTPAFGASTPGLFGAPSAPAFGATPTSAFGQASAPAFGMGASAPAFGTPSSSPFGASSAFGATSAFGSSGLFGAAARPPAFGFQTSPASTPAFGAPATSSSPFGATPGGLFGNTQAGSTSTFAFGSSFGATGSGFGATQSSPLFGSTGAASGGMFGSGTAPFGGFSSNLQTRPAGLTANTPAFSFGTGFGASAAAPSGSLFGASTGAASQPVSGLFGQAAPAMFGASAPSPFSSTPGASGLFSGFGTQQLGTQGQQAPQLLQQQQQQQLWQQNMLLQQQMLMGMAGYPLQSPYGVLPPLPPLPKPGGGPTFGLSGSGAATGIASIPRAADRRPTRTPRAAQRFMMSPARLMRQRAASRVRDAMLAKSWLFAAPLPENSSNRVPFFQEADSTAGVPRADTLVIPRENPRALFLREPTKEIPSPFASKFASAGPSSAAEPSAPPLPTEAHGAPASSSPSAPPVGGTADAEAARAEAEMRRKGKMPEGTLPPQAKPSPKATAAREAEIKAMLPKLRSSDWFTEPSMAELAARERAHPGFLSKVMDFTVGRRGFGSVKFLGETDVHRLDLETLIQFLHLELVVYPDEDQKPEEGTELNKPAEVTLQGVYCVNKATKERVVAGEALQRFMQRLRSKTTEQGAQFVSYDPANGEWVFRVQHFSRYRFDEDPDDEEVVGEQGGDEQGGIEQGEEEVQDPDLSGLEGGAEGHESRDSEEDMDAGEETDEDAPDPSWGQRGPLAAHKPVTAPRQGVDAALRARTRINTQHLQQMRSTLFSGEDEDDEMETGQARFTNSRPISSPIASPLWQTASFGQPGLSAESPLKVADGIRVTLRGSPMLLRSRGTPARSSPVRMPVKQEAPGQASGAFQGAAFQPVLNPQRAQAPSGCAIPELAAERLPGWSVLQPMKTKSLIAGGEQRAAPGYDEAKQVPTGATLVYRPHALKATDAVDAALFLGRSFRVGWGPGGVLVHSGKSLAATVDACGSGPFLSSRVSIQRVAYNRFLCDAEGGLVPNQLEVRLVESLKLHMEMSKVDVSSPDLQWPGRKVVCGRDGQLAQVCSGYAALAEAASNPQTSAGEVAEVTSAVSRKAGSSAAGQVLGLADDARGWKDSLDTEIMAWKLMLVLFGEDATGSLVKLEEGDLAVDGADEQKVQVMGQSDRGDGGQASAVTEFGTRFDKETRRIFRRVNVSDWLQEQVKKAVNDEWAQFADPCGLEAIFVHLTGMQVEVAVEKAVKRGDPRLATLLALSGAVLPEARFSLSKQVAIWKGKSGRAGGVIEEGRQRLLMLLSGDVRGAAQGRGLDWKRVFGLVLWFQCRPEEGIDSVLAAFQSLLAAQAAPRPLPLYAEDEALGGEGSAGDGEVEDILYGLLKVHAATAGADVGNSEDSGKTSAAALGVEGLRKLLTSCAWTPDPLDCQLGWHLQSLLQALGVMEGKQAIPAVHMDYAALLLAAGQCHWAVYVLQHMALSLGKEGSRAVERVVTELLTLYCPVWASSGEQVHFMRENLGVPQAWLEQAQAVYCGYLGDNEKKLSALLGSEQWECAHSLLMNQVAPKWLLAGNFAGVKAVAQALAPHKRSILFWMEGAGLLLDLDFLLSALEEQTEDDLEGGPGGDDSMALDEETPQRSKAALDDLARRTTLSLERFPQGADELRVVYGEMLGLLSTKLLADMGRRNCSAEMTLDAYDSALQSQASKSVRWAQMQGATMQFADWVNSAVKC